MATTASELYYDPYDFGIDADPYPVWKRLRDEAPLYYNEKYDFYAVSRYEDVERCFREWETYSSAKGSVLEIIKAGIAAAARPVHLRGPAGPRAAPWPHEPRLHAPAHGGHRAPGPRLRGPQAGPAGRRRWFRLRHRPRQRDPHAHHRDAARHPRGGPADDPGPHRRGAAPRGGRHARGRLRDAGQRDVGLRRLHRMAGRAPFGRPDDRAAHRGVHRRARHGAHADPGRDPRLHRAAGWRRQRDDHAPHRLGRPSCWPSTPTSAGRWWRSRISSRTRSRRCLRYEPPSPVQARFVTRDVEHQGQTVPAGSVDGAPQRVGQPRRAPVPGPGPRSTSTGRSAGTSASATGSTSAWARTWPASRPASRSRKCCGASPSGRSTTTTRCRRGRRRCGAGRKFPCAFPEVGSRRRPCSTSPASPQGRDDLWQVDRGPHAGLGRADVWHRVDRPVGGQPGDVAAHSSGGTGKRMSTSSGVSPSTRTCQPVSRRSQAGSTSVVRYQLALKLSSGPAPVQSRHLEALRRDGARLDPPRRDLGGLAGHRHLALRHDVVEREREGVGEEAQRPGERARRRGASTPRGSNEDGSRPNPMRSKIISGELRDDMSANSSIVRRSSRRCMDSRANGRASVMNPGLEPVL